MISEKHRTRNQTITLRVTPSERELFLRGAEKRNMTLTDFLVSAALYKPSHAIKECKAILKKLNEVQAELLRAESDHPDYADVLAAQKELYQLLFLLARKETIRTYKPKSSPALRIIPTRSPWMKSSLSFASAGKRCTS